MDEARFEQVVRDLLEGREVDWGALEESMAASERPRLRALRAVALATEATRTRAARAPEQWSGFLLLDPIGHGGYGEVWHAYDPQLDRFVALKLIPAEDDREAETVLREGRLLARIRHPNVATVYGATRVDAEIGVAMEFIGGDDLEHVVREQGPLPARDVRAIGVQLAHALDAVHHAGVLHRDIKASNVKRTAEGRVVLLDFGSSRELRFRAVDASTELGTPLYVAPEILHGDAATPQSDLYSLGVLLYYLASGSYPVGGASISELRDAHSSSAADKHRSGRAPLRLPRQLRSIVDALLSPDAAKRPPSATAVAARLAHQPRLRTSTAVLIIGAVVAAALLTVRGRLEPGNAADASTETARRLPWSIAPMEIGRASLDGRILPFADRRSGALAMMTISTGRVQDLTRSAGGVDGYAGDSAASPDGSRVAYEWHLSSRNATELRIFDMASGRAATVWQESGVELHPSAWAPDGRRVAGVIERPDGRRDLFVVAARAGATPTLITTNTYAGPASFSANGRYLVFEKEESPRGPAALWVANLEDLTLKRLPIQQTDTRTPVWWREELVFVSNTGGTTGIWAVNINPQTADLEGLPRELSRDETFEVLSVTANGSVICDRLQGVSQILIAGIDGSRVQQVSSGPAHAYSPDWSSDGRRLVWIEEPATVPLRHIVRIHAVTQGEERTFDDLVPAGHLIGANPRFSPDGARLLLRTSDGDFFVLNIQTREQSQRFFHKRNFGDIEWDDADHVFVLDFDSGVVRLDLRTGAEQWIYRVPRGMFMGRGIAVTPDRQRIAFVVQQGTHGDTATIMAASRDGSSVRPVVTRTRSAAVFGVPQFAATPLLLGDWTPDGREVLFAATDVLANGFTRWDTDLWAVSGDGGGAHKLGLSAPGLRFIRAEPHGSRVAYTLSDTQRDTWVLKGLLTEDTRER